VIRRDVDAHYDGLVYDDWMKGSPQETSLDILVVNGSFCPTYAIFQRLGWGSGGVVHINDATGNMKRHMM
jgi:hypothetical protein